MFQVDTTPNQAQDFLQAIISVAVADFFMGDRGQQADAVRYFQSDQYYRHLTMLGLPKSWLPAGIYEESIGTLNTHSQANFLPTKARG